MWLRLIMIASFGIPSPIHLKCSRSAFDTNKVDANLNVTMREASWLFEHTRGIDQLANPGDITVLATGLRNSIEAAKQANADIKWLPRFPVKCCNFAANLLVCELHDSGIHQVRRLIGTVDVDQDIRHVWVEVEGLVVDITADHYGLPPVVVSAQSSWHRELSETGPLLPKVDLENGLIDEQVQRLRDLYADVRSVLAKF